MRKLNDPKFQSVELYGKIIKLKQGAEKAFFIESEQLLLRYRHYEVCFQCSHFIIQKISLKLEHQINIELTISTLDDIQQVVAVIKTKAYWLDEEFQLFTLLLIKLLVASVFLSQHCKDTIENSQQLQEVNWNETQYELSKLLIGLVEMQNIDTSPYVATKRAAYLLLLGQNPKEQYTSEEVRKISKAYLKRLHPDILEGGNEIFKLVNEAQRYLKRQCGI